MRRDHISRELSGFVHVSEPGGADVREGNSGEEPFPVGKTILGAWGEFLNHPEAPELQEIPMA
jgi:hypothetical protein